MNKSSPNVFLRNTSKARSSRDADHAGVLFVGNFSRVSNRVSEQLAARLTRSGWDTLTTSAHANRAGRAADMLWTAWRLRYRYALAVVDVYSGAAFSWAEMVCAMLRRARKPYVLTLHGGNLPSFAKAHPDRVRQLLTSAYAVTSPSRYLTASMSDFRNDILVIPNGFDLDAFPFRYRAVMTPRMVWIRAFQDLYDPVTAVEVLRRVLETWPDAQLTMVGPDKDGSLSDVLKTAEKHGISDRLITPGWVPKTAVAEWLDRGDIFLNTTTADNAPGSVVEAMASGLCIVSTNAGGLPYLLSDGEDALLVPVQDPAAMTQAVQSVLRDPDLAPCMARNARRKVEGFAWDRVLPLWDALLRQTLGGPDLSPPGKERYV